VGGARSRTETVIIRLLVVLVGRAPTLSVRGAQAGGGVCRGSEAPTGEESRNAPTPPPRLDAVGRDWAGLLAGGPVPPAALGAAARLRWRPGASLLFSTILLFAHACSSGVAPAEESVRTVVVPVRFDTPSNTFLAFGDGHSQADRLGDGNDATGIRGTHPGLSALFRLDPDTLPGNIGRITQLTLVVRERFAFKETNGCWYACYIDTQLVQSILRFCAATVITDYERNLLVTGEERVTGEDLGSLQVGVFNTTWVDGDRWEIAELAVRLTYVPKSRQNVPAGATRHPPGGGRALARRAGVAHPHLLLAAYALLLCAG